MKIEGPSKTQGTDKAKKKSGAKGADGTFSDFMSSGVQKSVSSSPSQSIAQVDALLALQGAEDPTERGARNRAHHRADTILDKLDTIRLAMLGGNLTIGHMIDVADVVASHREKISDPKLTALMDEIDLRAQVELAKMSVEMGQKSV